MVKIKGHEISEAIAKESIKAMERLVYLYKNPKEYLECPLCVIFIDLDTCEKCPWTILKNYCCSGAMFCHVSMSRCRTRNRIRQLRRWIKIYQKALDLKK